jgi:hypothetical protein
VTVTATVARQQVEQLAGGEFSPDNLRLRPGRSVDAISVPATRSVTASGTPGRAGSVSV